MAAGHWMPNERGYISYDMVIVEPPSFHPDRYRLDMRDLRCDVIRMLPESFYAPRHWRDEVYRVFIGQDELVLAENRWVRVTFHDNGTYWYLTMRIWEDRMNNALAHHYLATEAPKLWDGLHDLGYSLARRAGPWSSFPYHRTPEPPKEVK